MTENSNQTTKTQKKDKKVEVKKSTFEKLGININVARVALCLNQRGANVNINTEIVNNQKMVDEFKKQSNYSRITLGVKMFKKVSAVVSLLEENNNFALSLSTLSTDSNGKKYTEREAAERKMKKNTDMINNLFKELKEGGVFKPVMKDVVDSNGKPVLHKSGKQKREFSKERSLTKFTELHPISENLDDLKKIKWALLDEFSTYINVYKTRKELSENSVKFNTSVKATVAYLLQEAISDILKHGLRDAKKNGHSKVDINNLRTEVVNQSPYAILFFNLPVLNEVEEFLIRKRIYDEDKLSFDKHRSTSKRGKKSIVKSFEEVERSEGYITIDDKKKKHWKGISLEKDSVSFVTYVTRLFDLVRSKIGANKLNISSRAREMVSNLMWQFLNKLSQRFDIHRNHKSSLKPEKNISFETAVEVFEIMLCSSEKSVLEVIKHARDIKLNLRELKRKKVDNSPIIELKPENEVTTN